MSGRSSRPASLNMLIRWPRFSYDPPHPSAVLVPSRILRLVLRPRPNPSHSAVRPDTIARLLHGATGARAVPCGSMLEQWWRTRVAADVVVLRSKPPIRSSGKRCGAPEGACRDPVAYREPCVHSCLGIVRTRALHSASACLWTRTCMPRTLSIAIEWSPCAGGCRHACTPSGHAPGRSVHLVTAGG